MFQKKLVAVLIHWIYFIGFDLNWFECNLIEFIAHNWNLTDSFLPEFQTHLGSIRFDRILFDNTANNTTTFSTALLVVILLSANSTKNLAQHF